MGDFNGKVVLVTGSGSGIGRASARAFAREGASVAVADINDVAGRETVDIVNAEGGKAEFFHVDVADEDSVGRLMVAVAGSLGPIDTAHNNAGIDGKVEPLLETTLAEWRQVLTVDLESVFLCLKAEIAHMLGRGGTIVNTASLCGLIGGYNHGAYTAAKHGVVGLTKAAAMEYIEQGIRINAVCPGPVDTPFMHGLPGGLVDKLRSGVPANRLGRPEEIAEAVLWLASERSGYVVGQALAVDGGTVLGGMSTKL